MSQRWKEKQGYIFPPDGIYNQINVNTLKAPDGPYLIQSMDIRVIGNPTDLLTENRGIQGNRAFLIGFPDYGSNEIPPLPGTRIEIERVEASLASTHDVKKKMAKEASESTLKKIENPKILHIATHGFFLEDLESGGSVFGVDIEYARNNPLLRAGIMLSGASAAATYSFGDEDNGILTAYESMNLNLNQTNLVVLSACETGKGDTKAGEGVYGLQRAFQVAGAENLLMSLWKVDDEATQKLMTSFYGIWTKTGDQPSVSFRQAQLSLMKTHDHPYYWGAFVMLSR